MNKQTTIFAGSLLLLAVAVLSLTVAQEKGHLGAGSAHDVLIVYFSGNTDVPKVPPLETGAVDAVTMPTPKVKNTAILAKTIADRLEEAGLSVRLATVDQIKDPRVVLRCKVLLVGTPSYFAYPSWQSLRFVDEVGGRIYYAGGDRLAGKWVGTFATADVHPHAVSASDHLLRSLGQLQAKSLPTVAVGKQTSPQEQDRAVTTLVQTILETVGNKGRRK